VLVQEISARFSVNLSSQGFFKYLNLELPQSNLLGLFILNLLGLFILNLLGLFILNLLGLFILNLLGLFILSRSVSYYSTCSYSSYSTWALMELPSLVETNKELLHGILIFSLVNVLMHLVISTYFMCIKMTTKNQKLKY
jgi:hypothetical protein